MIRRDHPDHLTCPPALMPAKEFLPALPSLREIVVPLIISLLHTKLSPFLISFCMESSAWFILSLKRTGIPGSVTSSCLSASHGCSQVRFDAASHCHEMLPCGRCKPEKGGQWKCPYRCKGLFRCVTHSAGGVGELPSQKNSLLFLCESKYT